MPECRLADGTLLAYQDRGTGRPLLLVHGWGMSRAVFAELEERLAGSWRCLGIDLPGHGHSPAVSEFTLERLGRMVAEFSDRLGLSDLVLVGWSLGGMVVQQAAASLQERLAGLVLISTTPRFVRGADWPHGLPDLQLRALRRDLQKNCPRALGDFFQLMFAGTDLARERFRAIVRFAAGAGRLPESGSLLAGLELLRRADLRGWQAGLELPCLVAHGVEDRIVPVGAGRHLAEQIGGSQLALFPDVGHAPFLQRPDSFLFSLESFLHGLDQA